MKLSIITINYNNLEGLKRTYKHGTSQNIKIRYRTSKKKKA